MSLLLSCGSRMAAATNTVCKAEGGGEEAAAVSRTSSGLPRVPQRTSSFISLARTVTWPLLAAREAAPWMFALPSLGRRQYKKRRLGIVVLWVLSLKNRVFPCD